MWHTELESKIVEHGRRKETFELDKIKRIIFEKHRFVMYAVTRFLSEYGDLLDENEPKAWNLYKHLFNEYSNLERLLTIIKHYEQQTDRI